MSEFDNPLELAKHKTIHKIFEAVEKNAKLKVDMSLIDEVVEAVSVAKEFRAKASEMRLPKRFKTEDDLHQLVEFLGEA